MADFGKAVSKLLEDEGGYAPEDMGRGAVNYGITLQTLRSWGCDIDQDGDVDADDIKALTPEKAVELYREKFWDTARLSEINDDRLAALIFALRVNQGPERAVRYVQRTLNVLGSKLTVDGMLGPKTMTEINTLDPAQTQSLISGIKGAAKARYEELYAANPTKYASVIQGWRSRLERL